VENREDHSIFCSPIEIIGPICIIHMIAVFYGGIVKLLKVNLFTAISFRN
jgi:hypothetical protein